MIRIALLALALAGCADPHLGDVYGRRLRTAFDAQRDAKTDGATLDADDAKLVSARHHSKPAPGTPGAAPTGGMGAMSGGQMGGSYGSSTSGMSTGVAPAPQTGLRLDAAR
jgi:hypothetical protein